MKKKWYTFYVDIKQSPGTKILRKIKFCSFLAISIIDFKKSNIEKNKEKK